ncbi:hypothetical protein [Actinomadura sp. 7K507]|uniref:hypothetical protein n=1 Tax=Actinomadura sp. 7K507 TaxID=2530365 RepID=UPI001052E04B|nr:hypothetical protein [Actinomadura sp. 7K507]TDC84035.1 hypothetical protein E1285_27660 [Actinomadura sp. 7K507]
MSEHDPKDGHEGVERGASEESSGAPLTPTEEETSHRPASDPPQPGTDEENPTDSLPGGRGGNRPEEANPDDFE